MRIALLCHGIMSILGWRTELRTVFLMYFHVLRDLPAARRAPQL